MILTLSLETSLDIASKDAFSIPAPSNPLFDFELDGIVRPPDVLSFHSIWRSGWLSSTFFKPEANSLAIESFIRIWVPRFIKTVGFRASHDCKLGSSSDTDATGKRMGPQPVTLGGMLHGKSVSGIAGTK